MSKINRLKEVYIKYSYIFTPATMSITKITQRFLTCLNKLVEEGKCRSKRHFALTLGYHPQGISEMMAERRDAPLELIEKAIECFHFNPSYLFTGKGSLFHSAFENDVHLRNLTIITDEHGDERILHIPIPAQAGYGKNLADPVYIRDLPSYTLPGHQFKTGTYRSFEISGTSMIPTFRPNDIVIAAYIEPRFWAQAVKNNQLYIIVTNEEIVIKRVLNRIADEKLIECLSDNTEFDPYTIKAAEIIEIWKVRMKITPYLETPSEFTVDSRLNRQLQLQQTLLENLQQQLTLRETANA